MFRTTTDTQISGEPLRIIDDGHGLVLLYLNVISTANADTIFDALLKTLPWKPEGKREIFYYSKLPYLYNGGHHLPSLLDCEILTNLLDYINQQLGTAFNSILCNLYRGSANSLGWHADNEHSLGKTPIIASLTLGSTRNFSLRQNNKHVNPKCHDVLLPHGCLLIMSGTIQQNWLHCVQGSTSDTSARINITFRKIF